MSPPIWLKAGVTLFSLDQLRKGILPASCTSQEKNAITFCSDWLRGQESFEFQTSGSTGVPKKISFTRQQLIASATLTQKALQYAAGDTALICLDVKFIAGAMMLVRCMVSHMNMVVTSPAANPLKSISDKIDFAAVVPLQLSALLTEENQMLNGLKRIIVGGASLDASLADQLQHISPSVYATYGMTETITHIALQKLNGIDRQDFFQALPGIEIAVDQRGCLVIQAPHLGTEPIVTNDVVTLLGSGQFRWTGRFDRVINSGGIKVQAELVEQIVALVMKGIHTENRFFIGSIPDVKLGEKLVLVIEGILNEDTESGLRAALAQQLPKYELPQMILMAPHFIETSTQKVDRIGTLKFLGFK